MKMTLKRAIASVLSVFLLVSALFSLSACNRGGADKAVIAAPDGAPALAMAGLLGLSEIEGVETDFRVVTSDGSTEAATVVGAKLVSGEYDMAVLPTNLAATLYNKGADIKSAAVVTWGNLYLVSKGAPLSGLAELEGKVVYTVSRSGPPDTVFKKLLSESGVAIASEDEYSVNTDGTVAPVSGKVVLKYMPATTIMPYLKQNKIEYAVLAEPAVTNAMNAVGAELKTVLDFQHEWQKMTGSNSYPQASLIVRSEFAEGNKKFVEEFINRLSDARDYLTEQENLDTAIQAVKALAPSTSLNYITVQSAARCGIKCLAATECKNDITDYLSLFNLTADDGFFYEK